MAPSRSKCEPTCCSVAKCRRTQRYHLGRRSTRRRRSSTASAAASASAAFAAAAASTALDEADDEAALARRRRSAASACSSSGSAASAAAELPPTRTRPSAIIESHVRSSPASTVARTASLTTERVAVQPIGGVAAESADTLVRRPLTHVATHQSPSAQRSPRLPSNVRPGSSDPTSDSSAEKMECESRAFGSCMARRSEIGRADTSAAAAGC